MKKIHDGSQGAVKSHHCKNFKVRGKISKGVVLGVCSKCKETIEDHGKCGEIIYKTEE